METELRETGISIVGDMPWGTHFCYFYETRQDLLDVLVPYFKAGLKNNEFCLWVISNSELLTMQEATSALQKALPDADRYFAKGSIEIVGHDEWFLDKGTFDLYTVANRFKQKLDDALDRGYAGMRVNGSPAWLYNQDVRELSKFEEELDSLFPNLRVIASCTYPLSGTRGAELLDIARAHQFVIARRHRVWEVLETPELKQAKEEINRLNQKLEQRVLERTRTLEATTEVLRREIAERKRAEEQLNATSEQLRALSESLRSAREEEGTRIARELHDELGSALTSLKWDLEEMSKRCSEPVDQTDYSVLRARTEEMMALVDDILSNVRRISSELRPGVLDDLGLIAAIEWQARQFESRSGIICNIDSLVDDLQLNREQSTAIFRILQEALTNILRHAQASQVNILVEELDEELVLEVRDNGRGITEDQIAGSHSLGLIGMRERVHLLGGRIEITGSAGRGTVLTLRAPIHAEPSD